MAMYMPAPEVADIAADLIDTVDRHSDLEHVRIDYVFIDEAPTSKGRIVLGRARKVTGLNALLAGSAHQGRTDGMQQPDPFFVVEIAHDYWTQVLTGAQQRALVDHELCHCDVEEHEDPMRAGEWKLSIVGHDVEEFSCVVQRHGLWDVGLTRLGQVMSEQLSLEINHITGSSDQ